MTSLMAVFLGGGIGSVLRYGISKWVPSPASGFPTATLLTNILACIVLGTFFAFFAKRVETHESIKLMVLTGFCGGFSTFSTFSLEMYKLIQDGQPGMAVLYAGASVAACLLVMYMVIKFHPG